MQQAFIWGLDALARWGASAASRNIKTVATIGAFDGVHRGHQQILRRLSERALTSQSLLSAVVVFEPQPQEFFAEGDKPTRLTSLREKVKSLHDFGIDIVVCLRFNSQLRSLSASDFLTEVLLKGLQIQHLEIGDDFRFGCDRQGDFEMLLKEGRRVGYSVNSSHTYEEAGLRISSTRIREALEQRAFREAELLLGRPYSVAGKVVYGRQLGRKLGLPTANIRLRYSPAIQTGVFAVAAQLQGQAAFIYGVANLGVKPTVDDDKLLSLEVHLFEYDDNLYGQCLRVFFHDYIRSEKTFSSIDELKTQILQDCTQAKQYFQDAAQR